MFLIANFKAHAIHLSAYIEKLKTVSLSKVKILLAPPFPYLTTPSSFPFVAQDVSAKTEGAFTGEVTGSMLKNLGVSYSLIGHSERRTLYHETPILLREKYLRLKENNIKPILCVGETLEEHQKGDYLKRIVQEIQEISGSGTDLWIAYEPIWAIGTGQIPSIETIIEILHAIRQHFPKARFLYGGSVNAQNSARIASVTDGLLVGSASNNVNTFIEIVQQLEKI